MTENQDRPDTFSGTIDEPPVTPEDTLHGKELLPQNNIVIIGFIDEHSEMMGVITQHLNESKTNNKSNLVTISHLEQGKLAFEKYNSTSSLIIVPFNEKSRDKSLEFVQHIIESRQDTQLLKDNEPARIIVFTENDEYQAKRAIEERSNLSKDELRQHGIYLEGQSHKDGFIQAVRNATTQTRRMNPVA